MATLPMNEDFVVLGSRVEMWAAKEQVDAVLAARLLRLFPRAQVAGHLLLACMLLGYDPVAR